MVAAMEIADAFVVHASAARVWDAMLDPEVMRLVLPGCRRLEPTGPGSYAVTLATGIGVLRGVFTGELRLHDRVAPASCRLDVHAQGSLGRVTGAGGVRLLPDGSATRLEYTSEFAFAGPLAALGQPLIRSVATALAAEGMRRFRDLVSAEGSHGAGDESLRGRHERP